MKKSFFGFRVFPAVIMLMFQLVSGCACSESRLVEEEAEPSLVLMTWNVNNLFDGKDNGFEYDEFKESASWSVEKYLGRVNSISAAIETIKPAPDIIILQEIESLVILADIAYSLSGGYSWSHFANNPGAALGIGILSRVPLGESTVHSITINGVTTPRPVLETRVDTDRGSFAIFPVTGNQSWAAMMLQKTSAALRQELSCAGYANFYRLSRSLA